MNDLFYLRLLDGTIIIPASISTKFDKKAIMEITVLGGGYTLKSELNEIVTENDVEAIVLWIWDMARDGFKFIDINKCPRVIDVAERMENNNDPKHS